MLFFVLYQSTIVTYVEFFEMSLCLNVFVAGKHFVCPLFIFEPVGHSYKMYEGIKVVYFIILTYINFKLLLYCNVGIENVPYSVSSFVVVVVSICSLNISFVDHFISYLSTYEDKI